jgi:RimJ/RimL family protein N-acetyltransferase
MGPLDTIDLFTRRLLLRPLGGVDAAALLEIHAEPRVMEFSNSPPWTRLEQAKELIRGSSERWITDGQKSDSVLLGLLQSDWRARAHGVHS